MNCIQWRGDHIRLIDQRLLPGRLEYISCFDVDTLGDAIRSLAIRGAPALGISAGYGLALAAIKSKAEKKSELIKELNLVKGFIASTRPTAVNLFWALERIMTVAEGFSGDVPGLKAAIMAEADGIFNEDRKLCHDMGRHGSRLIKDGFNIIHHCNTGFLATGEHGTALGVIRSAHSQGKKIHVWVDETRPLLQGSRLTAWELQQDNIPYTVITDNMAGWLMAQKKADMVITGADRITAKGDVANKIGTYSLAVLARYHNIPYYCAAPSTTIDFSIEDKNRIIIEERSPDEVLSFQGVPSAPAHSPAYNPAFDVTPAELVTAIITEGGVIEPPYEENLLKLKRHGNI